MNAPETEPKVNYPRFNELAEEFTRLWTRLQAFYLDAVIGFDYVRQFIQAEQAQARGFVRGTELDSEEFQDTRGFSYDRIFAGSFVTSAIHEATQGEVKARNAPGGANYTTLAQLCVVSFYDFWSDYLRREYAIAKGVLDPNEKDRKVIDACLSEHVRHDLWGDLRQLRQSIVHNRGFAVSDVIRCKLIRWFKPGDAIVITPDGMRRIFLALLAFRNELFRQQFRPHYIQLP